MHRTGLGATGRISRGRGSRVRLLPTRHCDLGRNSGGTAGSHPRRLTPSRVQCRSTCTNAKRSSHATLALGIRCGASAALCPGAPGECLPAKLAAWPGRLREQLAQASFVQGIPPVGDHLEPASPRRAHEHEPAGLVARDRADAPIGHAARHVAPLTLGAPLQEGGVCFPHLPAVAGFVGEGDDHRVAVRRGHSGQSRCRIAKPQSCGGGVPMESHAS